MKLSIISFTENGKQLSEQMTKTIKEIEVTAFTKYRKHSDCIEKDRTNTAQFVESSVSEWAKEQMHEKNALLFIGACGIAVRAIAPHLTDKLHDSPVLVMDERGRHLIPILSGHIGGANELAYYLAEKTGAEAVITTATDINQVFAVDLFAKRNELFIVNKEGIAKVSSQLLAGKEITLSIETGHRSKKEEEFLPSGVRLLAYPPNCRADILVTSEDREFDAEILLKPKEYSIGIGCRKGKRADQIETFILKKLQEFGISVLQVFVLTSILQKREESGIIEWCRKENIPFVTYTAEELRSVEGNFQGSAFVEEKVGVDNVCERAALKACGLGGRLICKKYAEDGMTIAIAKREWRVELDEE